MSWIDIEAPQPRFTQERTPEGVRIVVPDGKSAYRELLAADFPIWGGKRSKSAKSR